MSSLQHSPLSSASCMSDPLSGYFAFLLQTHPLSTTKQFPTQYNMGRGLWVLLHCSVVPVESTIPGKQAQCSDDHSRCANLWATFSNALLMAFNNYSAQIKPKRPQEVQGQGWTPSYHQKIKRDLYKKGDRKGERKRRGTSILPLNCPHFTPNIIRRKTRWKFTEAQAKGEVQGRGKC